MMGCKKSLTVGRVLSSAVLVSLVLAACSSPVGGNSAGGTDASGNQPPSVTGTQTLGGTVDDQVDLVATATDPEDAGLTFEWGFTSQPASSTLGDSNVGNRNSLTAHFTPTHAGTYELELLVSDGEHTVSVVFTVNVTVGKPDEPTSADPTNGATGVPVNEVLGWNANGATTFDVYLSDSSFSAGSPPAPASENQVASSYNPPGDLEYDTTYYWMIVATNGDGDTTGSVWSFTTEDAPLPGVPQLQSPANNATNLAPEVTLDWNAATLATSYTVYLGTSGTFSEASPQASSVTDTDLTVSSLSYNTTYYWWVEARNGNLGPAEQGPTAGPRSFTTIVQAPAAPGLTAPANNASVNGRLITLDWNSAARASEYDLYLDPPSGGASVVYTGTDTDYSLSSPADGNYSWWVVAKNAGGNTQSATRSFTVDTVAPSVSITGGPSGPTNDSTPTFTFSVSGGATTVECRINSGSYQDCASGSYTPSSLSDGDHTFTVRAGDAAGNARQRSRSFSVDTVAPASPYIFTNPNSVEYHLSSAEYEFLTLSFSGEVFTYECRLYRTDVTVLLPAFTACSSPRTYSVTYPRSYRFQVRAVDEAGNRSSPSSHDFDNRVIF